MVAVHCHTPRCRVGTYAIRLLVIRLPLGEYRFGYFDVSNLGRSTRLAKDKQKFGRWCSYAHVAYKGEPTSDPCIKFKDFKSSGKLPRNLLVVCLPLHTAIYLHKPIIIFCQYDTPSSGPSSTALNDELKTFMRRAPDLFVDEDLFNIAQHWPELRRTIAHLRYDANSSCPNEATIRLHVHGLLPKVFGLERIPENTRLAIQ